MKNTMVFSLCLLWSTLLWAQSPAAPTATGTETATSIATDTGTTTNVGTGVETGTSTGTETEVAPAPEPAKVEITGAQGDPSLVVKAPVNGSGLKLDISWDVVAPDTTSFTLLRSAKGPQGPWTIAKSGLGHDKKSFTDKVVENVTKEGGPKDTYWYQLLVLPKTFEVTKKTAPEKLLQASYAGVMGQGNPVASWFKTGLNGIYLLLILIIAVTAMMFGFTAQVRGGKEIKIRRIPGIDAIEEGIGRATEMGKPVLYVPGIDSLEDIQTIASMLILGEVSKTIAEYQTDVIVSCCVPIVREVADEVVKSGYYRAGHPDAYDPTSVRFVASEQFAFCAGTNGIMYRQKPATNIYLGRFFAESLILAETGFVNRSIQIAGTAEATQLPFFIAACDYTLIGEELFAVSAYLSKDPRLVSSLKASDWVKLATVGLLVIGAVTSSFGYELVSTLFKMAGG